MVRSTYWTRKVRVYVILILAGIVPVFLMLCATPSVCGDGESELPAINQPAIGYIQAGDLAAAQNEVDALIQDFAGQVKLAAALYGIGEAYRDQQRYFESKMLDEYVAENYPGSDQAFWAQARHAGVEIMLGNYDAGEAIIESLKQNYAEHRSLSDAFVDIGNEYLNQKRYDAAQALYSYVVENYPGSMAVVSANTQLAISSIKEGDYVAAGAVVEAFKRNYADHPDLSENILKIGVEYCNREKVDEAIQLYAYITDFYPESDQAFFALARWAGAEVISGNYTNAETLVDTLLTSYFAHEALADNLYAIANEYVRHEQFTQAKSLYDYIAKNYPEKEEAMAALTRSAMVDILEGNNATAEATIATLKRSYGDHPKLPQAIYEFSNPIWHDWYNYWYNKDYDAKYRPVYEYIVTNHADSDLALGARTWLVAVDVQSGNFETVDQAADSIIKDFAGHPNLPYMLYRLAQDHCWLRWRFETCKRLLGYIIQNYPESDLVVEALAGHASADIRLGNFSIALETINVLTIDYYKHPALPELLYKFAQDYRIAEKYGESQWMYQYILDRFPANQKAQSYAELGLTIAEADSNGILVDWEEFVNNVGLDHPLLSELLIEAKKEYSVKGRLSRMGGVEERALRYFHQEAAICEETLRIFPASPDHTPSAHYGAAVIYGQDLHDYAKAIEHFQRVAEDWPEYLNADHAQFSVGGYYKSQMNRGDISAAEAKPLIEQAYRAVVENYPDSPYAKRAASKLPTLE